MNRLPPLTAALAATCLAALSLAACDPPDALPPTPAEPLASVAVGDTTLVVRRVSTEPAALDVFPDGRRLVVSDRLDNNLQVQLTGSGARMPLTSDGSASEGRWPRRARVSPDGARVAYIWHDASVSTFELRVVNADGTGQRTLAERDFSRGDISFELAGWSPDGRSVLVLESEYLGDSRLLAVDVEGGSTTTVYDFGRRSPGIPRMSPVGNRIAVSLRSGDEITSRDLYLLDLATGTLERVVDLTESVELADWGPEGGALYFVTERDNLTTLWRQRLEDGTGSGEPERLRSGLDHFRAIGYAGDGIFFREYYGPWSVQHAQLTAGSDGIAAPPAPLAEPVEGGVVSLAWSPDALYLAYVRLDGSSGPATWHLVVRSRSGEERVFAPSFPLGGFLDWRSEGLFVVGQPDGRSHLYRVDFEAGRLVQVEKLGAGGAPGYSADGRHRLFTRTGPPRQLIVLDGETGRERVLLEGDNFSTARISPDGQQVAVIRYADQNRTRIELLSIRTGDSRVIHTSSDGSGIHRGSMGWTPDGSAIVILEWHGLPTNSQYRFRRVSQDGTVKDILELSGEGAAVTFALSPDGRHLAYGARMQGQERHGVWVVEGLER